MEIDLAPSKLSASAKQVGGASSVTSWRPTRARSRRATSSGSRRSCWKA